MIYFKFSIKMTHPAVVTLDGCRFRRHIKLQKGTAAGAICLAHLQMGQVINSVSATVGFAPLVRKTA